MRSQDSCVFVICVKIFSAVRGAGGGGGGGGALSSVFISGHSFTLKDFNESIDPLTIARLNLTCGESKHGASLMR